MTMRGELKDMLDAADLMRYAISVTERKLAEAKETLAKLEGEIAAAQQENGASQ